MKREKKAENPQRHVLYKKWKWKQNVNRFFGKLIYTLLDWLFLLNIFRFWMLLEILFSCYVHNRKPYLRRSYIVILSDAKVWYLSQNFFLLVLSTYECFNFSIAKMGNKGQLAKKDGKKIFFNFFSIFCCCCSRKELFDSITRKSFSECLAIDFIDVCLSAAWVCVVYERACTRCLRKSTHWKCIVLKSFLFALCRCCYER